MSEQPDIIYTKVDEAPELASASLLPIIQAFTKPVGIRVGTKDISLAGRIIAQFPDRLPKEQQQPDDLALLGELVEKPEANIIKLPNISASIPQIKAAIAELQSKGYAVPDYPEDPQNEPEKDIKARYDRVKGSAVNPVLRQGNSDRRASASVKQYAQRHPHSMGEWPSESRSHVSTMADGDFRSTERSVTLAAQDEIRIEHRAPDGTTTVLKESIPVLAGEVLDAAVMRRRALEEFLAAQMAETRDQGLLFSVHLK